jgi:hypothetical protein
MLAAAVSTHDPSTDHVRTSEPAIVALLDAGRRSSPTFRELLKTLDESDVIVYVKPKLTRPGLNAYLAHNIVASGGYRYLRIAVELRGAWRHLVASLGHELQHAVEVARAPTVRDDAGLVQMFERSNLKFGCQAGAGECYETKAAKDVEATILEEVQ